MFAFGCCASSWDRVNGYVKPFAGERPLLTVWGASSIATAYNQILDSYRDDVIDGLVLQHDDLEITDPEADTKLLTALTEPEVALVGVAGARTCSSIAWWEGDVVGHQLIDEGLIDFGERAGDVTALEGSIIVMSPWAVAHLRFDTTYDGFHGYDCDVAMTARERGKRVLVADVDTHHHTRTGFKSPGSVEDWQRADRLFRSKWFGRATH